MLKAESRPLETQVGGFRLLQVMGGMSLKLLLWQPHHPPGIVQLLLSGAAPSATQAKHILDADV